MFEPWLNNNQAKMGRILEKGRPLEEGMAHTYEVAPPCDMASILEGAYMEGRPHKKSTHPSIHSHMEFAPKWRKSLEVAPTWRGYPTHALIHAIGSLTLYLRVEMDGD